MCDWQYSSGEAETRGFSVNPGVNRSHSSAPPTWQRRKAANNPGTHANTPSGAPRIYKTDPLTIELYKLQELLRDAAKEMSLTRFVELRREFNNIWLEVLEKL